MFPTIDVITASCAIHRLNEGFLSKDNVRFDKKLEGKKSNSDYLYDHFYSQFPLDIIDADKVQAEEVIDYLKGLSFKAIERELTEFESNVLKLVNSKEVEKDKLGISASLPKVYLNKVEQDNWTSRETVLANTSQAIGTLHQRGDFTGIVEYVRYIPKTMSYLISCSVDNKHILKFFTDKSLKLNSKISVEGYVKSQNRGRYHNGIETLINRIKIADNS